VTEVFKNLTHYSLETTMSCEKKFEKQKKKTKEDHYGRKYTTIITQDNRCKTTKENHSRSVASYGTQPQNNVGGLI